MFIQLNPNNQLKRMLLNKNGVPLPVATKRQTLEAEAGEKGKKFYSMLNDLGEWGTPHFKLMSSAELR